MGHISRIISSVAADAVLSFVDEDAFGEEGRDADMDTPGIVTLLRELRVNHLHAEIYTRLEQVFDRSWPAAAAIRRLSQWRDIGSVLQRVFVGVESGCNRQLRRYGKGQRVVDIVDGLRAASLLGLNLEFGFITFDPLLTQSDLLDNLTFLARRDILSNSRSDWTAPEIYTALGSGLYWQDTGVPVFMRVAYLATELELFRNSTYVRMLMSVRPDLVGGIDQQFARYDYRYADADVGEVARWCRLWTEGAFDSIYALRIASRSSATSSDAYRVVIERYRHATYALMVALARIHCSQIAEVRELLVSNAIATILEPDIDVIDHATLQELWRWVVGLEELPAADFDPDALHRRRVS